MGQGSKNVESVDELTTLLKNIEIGDLPKMPRSVKKERRTESTTGVSSARNLGNQDISAKRIQRISLMEPTNRTTTLRFKRRLMVQHSTMSMTKGA